MIFNLKFLREHVTRLLHPAFGAVSALVLVLLFSACQKEEKTAATSPRPVRTITVEKQNRGEKVSLTGEIQPRYQADLGFRINGKIL